MNDYLTGIIICVNAGSKGGYETKRECWWRTLLKCFPDQKKHYLGMLAQMGYYFKCFSIQRGHYLRMLAHREHYFKCMRRK